MRISIFALLFCISILYCCKNDFSTSAAYDQGHEVQLAHCVSCHGIDGEGNNGSYPALADRTITEATTKRAVLLITQGSALMKPLQLENDEVEKVVHYIENS